jgi:hypothetical protein
MQVARICLTSTLLFCLASAAAAQEGSEEEAKMVESKAESVPRAKFVDFGTELGLDSASLDGLGERIDSARVAANPIELAVAAKLLAAAESVSGKSAAIHSQGLLEESVKLAKQRSIPTELSIVAKLAGGDAAKDLEAQAQAVSEETPKEPEDARDLYGDLVVDNHSHSEVHVYVNGHEIGHVHPHAVAVFHVHHAHFAEARDHFGHHWQIYFPGHQHRWQWVLMDPHHPH